MTEIVSVRGKDPFTQELHNPVEQSSQEGGDL